MKKKVFILILNWNCSQECLRLYHQLQPLLDDSYDYNILIIDNNSKPAEQDALKKTINASSLFFTGENLGYAGGNNAGIRKGITEGADFFCILNPDISVDNNFLKPLLIQLEQDSSIGVIGPRILDKHQRSLIFSDGALVFPEQAYKVKHQNINVLESDVDTTTVKQVDYVNGSAIVFSKTILEKAGFMREDFFMYFEETEWCLRIKKLGYKVVVNSTIKVYHENSNQGNLFHYYMNRNRLWLAKIVKEKSSYTQWKYVKKMLKEIRLVALNPAEAKKNHSISKIKGTLAGLLTNPSKS